MHRLTYVLTQSGTVIFRDPPERRSTMSKAKEPARMTCRRRRRRRRRKASIPFRVSYGVRSQILNHLNISINNIFRYTGIQLVSYGCPPTS